MAPSDDTVALSVSRHNRTFAVLSLDRPLIMGVVNATPDSFSDGGHWFEADAAVRHARRLVADGADIIDVGGESTRPGAEPVGADEECRRVVPIIRTLAADGLVVSVDTRRSAVMAAAIDAGACIVNDVTALTGDPKALPLVASSSVGVVLMHMQGDPRTMQVEPRYVDAPREIFDWLAARVARCREAGIAAGRIAVDPGIGFGKTVRHNVELLAGLSRYRDLGSAVVIGVSRKSFIARLSREEPPDQRLAGSLAAALTAVARGADILRVHDVAATRQALAVWLAIEETARQG
jgi:dihydropteroate synthase